MRAIRLGLLIGFISVFRCLGVSPEDPLVSVTSPASGDIFTVGEKIVIEAAIQKPQLIQGVWFYINGYRVGLLDDTLPYQSDLIELTGAGIYEVQAVVQLADGRLSESPLRAVYAIPVEPNEYTLNDGIINVQQYITQIYRDLLFREPTDNELNYLVQELEFELSSRDTILNALMENQEFQALLDAHNAYQMITGEWPDPIEFQAVVENYRALSKQKKHPVNSAPLEGSNNEMESYPIIIEDEFKLHAYSTGSADTVAELRDSSGSRIAYDDDSGVAFNFDLNVLLQPGEYTLIVSGYLGKSGNYSLHTNLDTTTHYEAIGYLDGGFLDYVIDAIYADIRDQNFQLIEESELKQEVDALFENRFEKKAQPARSQENQRGLQAVGRLEDFASSLVRNLPLGYSFEGLNLAEVKSRDTAAYLISNLLKQKPSRERIRSMIGLAFAEKVDALLHDEDFRLRFEPENASITDEISQSSIQKPIIHKTSIFSDLPANDRGWKYSDWFGYVSDLHFPWVYQESIGWTYMEKTEDDIWLWNEYVDAAYTRDDLFPDVFRYSDSQWIYLFLEQDDGVSIFNYQLGVWE